MSFVAGWFHRSQEEDYETALQNLALSIQNRRSRLSDIRLRERRATLLATLYTLAAWLLYISLWYMGFFSHGATRARIIGSNGQLLRAAPLFLGPIVILAIRRSVQVWYVRKENAEEKTLRMLLKEQRSKVEEIKKKTNYYSTRNLLERYDEVEGTPLRRHVIVSGTPYKPSPPSNVPTSAPISISPQEQRIQLSQQPPTPLRKQWYDKLADALLGGDEESVNDANKYALICEKCFSHNGLVDAERWPDTSYICPKCKHFNASVRSKSQASGQIHPPVGATSPESPLSLSTTLNLPSGGSPTTRNGDLNSIPSTQGSSDVMTDSSEKVRAGEGALMMEVDS